MKSKDNEPKQTFADDSPLLYPAPLAYENKKFLNGPDGRILRIFAEYPEPLARFRRERFRTRSSFSARRGSTAAGGRAATCAAGQAGIGNARSARGAGKAKRARAAVEMARYYEDARRLAFLLTEWSEIPARPRTVLS